MILSGNKKLYLMGKVYVRVDDRNRKCISPRNFDCGGVSCHECKYDTGCYSFIDEAATASERDVERVVAVYMKRSK